MTQADYDVANASGATVRADINAHLDAIVTNNGGASAPSTTFSNMWWFDESNDILKQRNKANSAWINVAQKDGSGWRPYWNGTQLDSVFQGLDATLTSIAAVAGVAGDILYADGTDTWTRLAKDSDGKYLILASGIPAWSSVVTRESEVATTSGTAHGFTGIKAAANRITFMFRGLSLTGSDNFLIQIGDAGGYELSGYRSGASENTAGGSSGDNSTGYLVTNVTGGIADGVVTLARLEGFTWVCSGGIYTANPNFNSGFKTLTAELTQVRVTRTGSDTFDAGEINILIE